MNINLETTAPALIAIFTSLGGGAFITKLAWQYLFDIKEVYAVIIDVADLNKVMEEMIKTAIANGYEFESDKRVAYYEQQLDHWLMAQGVMGSFRVTTVTRLMSSVLSLEKTIVENLHKSPDTPTK